MNTPCLLCWLIEPVSTAKSPTTLCPANTTRQPNAGSTLVYRRRLWPSTIQHWTVVSVGSVVSTVYKLALSRCLLNVGYFMLAEVRTHTQQTQYVEPMLVYCWFTVYDAEPTINQHWPNVLCLLGSIQRVNAI